MGLWEDLPRAHRRNAEQVRWEGAAAVMTATVIDDRLVTIDTAGVDRGFLIVTTQQVVYGHRKKLRGRPEPWDSFELDHLQVNLDDPRGVAFRVKTMGPIDMVLATPARDLDRLKAVIDDLWGQPDDGLVMQQLREIDGRPVDTWESCPLCEGPIAARVEHAVVCGDCGRCWADPDFEPVISGETGNYGELIGAEPWQPLLLVEGKYAGHTRAFSIRPKHITVGPLFVPLLEINDILVGDNTPNSP